MSDKIEDGNLPDAFMKMLPSYLEDGGFSITANLVTWS